MKTESIIKRKKKRSSLLEHFYLNLILYTESVTYCVQTGRKLIRLSYIMLSTLTTERYYIAVNAMFK